MPEVELLKYPSREGGSDLQEQGDLQAVCPGRRRSCALVNTPSPCVNKAVCHIQELKKKLEHRGQQAASTQHENSEEQNHNRNILRFASSDPKNDIISAELCVEGMGLCIRDSGALTPLRKETTDVLTEVTYLIHRLEADRQEAEGALHKERRRRRRLGRKIDSFTLWKQQEFPVAVQKEHEACTRDITELKWHLKLRRDKLQQVEDRLVQTEVLNRRLNEDIGFVKKHGPLVKEKLQLESQIMSRIKNAQNEANDTYTTTFSKLQASQQELERAEIQADKHKRQMDLELTGFRNQLRDRLNELQQLQLHWVVYCSKVREVEEQVNLKDDQCNAMLQQIPELEGQETQVNDCVVELKSKIAEEVRKMGKTKDDISDLQEQIQATRHAGEMKVSESEEVFRKKRQDLMALHDENKEHELEIEDYNKKVSQSEQAVKQLQKDRKRVLQKISHNEEQRELARDELSQVATLHGATRAELEDLEEQTFMEEQRRRKVTENLKKQMMGEMKALAIIKGKIATIRVEYDQEQSNTEKAERELQREFEEASCATAELETELAELQQIYNEKYKKIENLQEKLSNIQKGHRNVSDGLEEKKTTQLNHLRDVTELHSIVATRLQHAQRRIEDLGLKSKEYRRASDLMEKVATTIPDIIEELQSVLDAVEFKHKTAASVITNLQRDICDCRARAVQCEQSHAALFTNRQITMDQTKANLKQALRENAEIAHEYRDLQKALMIAKREAVCVFDERNRAEFSFHDHKQLSLLQKRMHKATVKYFKHRSLHSQAELARFQELSNENNQKIKTVQEELSEAIQRISAFLRSLTDDSTNPDDAIANKQPGLDANGLNTGMPTVQIAV